MLEFVLIIKEFLNMLNIYNVDRNCPPQVTLYSHDQSKLIIFRYQLLT